MTRYSFSINYTCGYECPRLEFKLLDVSNARSLIWPLIFAKFLYSLNSESLPQCFTWKILMDEQTEVYLRHVWNLAYASSMIGKGDDKTGVSANGYTISRALNYSLFGKLVHQMNIPLAENVAQRICRSCGSILIPGATVRVSIRKNSSRRGSPRNHVRYSCLSCGGVAVWDGALSTGQIGLKAEMDKPITPIPRIVSSKVSVTKNVELEKSRKPPNDPSRHPLKSLLATTRRRLSNEKKLSSNTSRPKLSDFLSSL
jgi:RNase P subunit RPR2